MERSTNRVVTVSHHSAPYALIVALIQIARHDFRRFETPPSCRNDYQNRQRVCGTEWFKVARLPSQDPRTCRSSKHFRVSYPPGDRLTLPTVATPHFATRDFRSSPASWSQGKTSPGARSAYGRLQIYTMIQIGCQSCAFRGSASVGSRRSTLAFKSICHRFTIIWRRAFCSTGIVGFVISPGGYAATILWRDLGCQYVIMLGPLAFVIVLSFGINSLSTTAAQLLFWAFAAMMGLSGWPFNLSGFHCQSIATTSFFRCSGWISGPARGIQPNATVAFRYRSLIMASSGC